ncbi:hypothetical protein PMI15_00260, partial [Polaromonas sp. CF318]|uniref:hypothetical protein n=1 Tax=Polaromonas sp. CF318 TaxID=1144318 RepID=UPI0002710F97
RRWSWLPSIRIHRIMREDQDRDFHDHPWNARTIVLRGGYTEALPGQPYLRTRLPGMTGRLLFGEYHRITSVSVGGVWTLFFTWKYQGTWGFLVDGKKVPWREYLGKNKVSNGSAVADQLATADATAAVIEAARQWSADREIQDWSEADLMKAIATLDGDWPGCDDCQFDCDEPCMPSTVAQFHRAIDCQVAQLVHDGKLPKYEGYEPPQGFVPTPPRRKRIPIASHHQP